MTTSLNASIPSERSENHPSPFNLSIRYTHVDLQQIKQIIELMKRAELTEFEFEDKNGTKLRLQREGSGKGGYAVAPVAVAAPVAAAPAPVAAAPAAAPAPAADAANIKTITSPMVGTFYAAASPDAAPFAAAGTPVKADTVVCIIEAMKVMNEVQGEIAGTIVEVLVANGTSVEFGQPLFKVKTA